MKVVIALLWMAVAIDLWTLGLLFLFRVLALVSERDRIAPANADFLSRGDRMSRYVQHVPKRENGEVRQ